MSSASERLAFRDSGIHWLGKIPAHWRVAALKHIVSVPITDGPHETPEFVDSGIPFVSAEAVWDGRVHLETVRGYISHDVHDQYSKKYRPEKNDIYVVKSGATTGKVAIVDLEDEFSIWSPLAAVRCDREQALPRFIFHSLVSEYFQGQVRTGWSLGTQPNIGMEVLENLCVVLPPLNEQHAIADYLDRETERIDALVSAKERALGLVVEKRRALITRAVTRGLDPCTPLCDSGTPWLGEIPAHWSSTQLKRAATVIDCKHRTVPFTSEGIPLASIREVQSWEVDLTSAKMTTEEEYLLMIEGDRDPRPGDVIVSRNATVGAAALVPDRAQFCMGQDVSLVRPGAELEPAYLNWLFRSDGVANQVTAASIGSTFFRINVEQIKELLIPLPPLGEQRAIVRVVGSETSKLDTLRSAIERTISLLKERRTALIAAAVTGRLDMQGAERHLDVVAD